MVARRTRLLGPGLRQFYEFPFHPVHGDGVWLYDEKGRRYLDAYNNVPHVGHCHPEVVAALARQAATINSNSRYLDRTILDYAERLIGTMPAGLDVCVFVCTGSEANDLAGRLARAFSGASGFIASTHAYHGNTTFLAGLDAWGAATSRASVARVRPPRGGAYGADFVEAVARLKGGRHGIAAAYIDTCFANEGLVPPDQVNMQTAIDALRAAGGLYIADEVQAGLGRLGDRMWGFQLLGPVPDIVTMGKPLGNGHPIGAVVTRREILEAFLKRDRYFNTFGGNPVSCAVGLAVLDVLERENLMAHATQVGADLHTSLTRLARSHPGTFDPRGKALFQGVAILDPATGRAAPDRARRIMNEMARRGVLVGLTGPDREIVKIRPPMPFDAQNAALLVEVLDSALAVTSERPDAKAEGRT
jgi:4-aminobutyrate aminotransferase-like enzyme